jgi:ariadne-1
VVPHSFFLKYLPVENGHRQKYLNWHCKQMTDQNKNIKWCPQKGCDYMAEKTVYALKNVVECKCGNSFCFSCENEDHLPATCAMVKIWKEKESSDSENLTWIKANTKPCPKCTSLIEKNQGCMHMTCQKCMFNFCWLCLTEWSKHGSTTGGYYACNIYDDLKKSNKEFKK